MSSDVHSAYKKLVELTKDLIILQSAEAIIHWDMETMMPPRGIEQRSQQLALLSRLSHKMSTSPEIGSLLNEILNSPQYETLTEVEKRNVYLIKKNYDEQTQLPEKLVAEIARQQALTVNTWKKAKAAKSFSMLQPELEKLVELNREKAEILMRVKAVATPYDALIDIFEPKMTAAAIAPIFEQLQNGLVTLLRKIQNAPNQPNTAILKCSVPVETQRQIAKALAETMGYDVSSPTAAGRIDETEHPFTTGYYDDVRITTHYYPEEFASSIFSVLHETGHALYEQGLPREWKYQPVGASCSYGIHESQSRFVENIIGRSREFWSSFLPKLKAIAGVSLAHLELDSFVSAINEVKPSKIRVEADEVTYCLHIVIRFQIERDLFGNKIEVNQLPEIWNQKYEELLGLKIENDAEGVMQDTHWASGYYGYFPSYALGNIYSGQLLSALAKDIGDWQSQLAEGNTKNIMEWLAKNVHAYGALYDPNDLITKITGRKLDAGPYLQYLQEKYSTLYGF
ncbi:MAG: carboxypeptidase M32 [Candidatus Bathyarchaeota archaeon]|nr:carboxypeptidase M32 [Candidatus Bathyarchaeota archaeon]